MVTKVAEQQDHTRVYDLGNRVSRSIIAVIDILTQRGAFKGEELSTIGGLRDQAAQLIQLAEAYQAENASN
jgi:GAF domain-containing protein